MQHPNHVKVSPWGGKIEGQSFSKSGFNRGEVLAEGFIYREIERKGFSKSGLNRRAVLGLQVIYMDI